MESGRIFPPEERKMDYVVDDGHGDRSSASILRRKKNAGGPSKSSDNPCRTRKKPTSHPGMQWVQLMDNIQWKPSGVSDLDEVYPEEDRLVLFLDGVGQVSKPAFLKASDLKKIRRF